MTRHDFNQFLFHSLAHGTTTVRDIVMVKLYQILQIFDTWLVHTCGFHASAKDG